MVTLHNTGVCRIYNTKVLGCTTRAKRGQGPEGYKFCNSLGYIQIDHSTYSFDEWLQAKNHNILYYSRLLWRGKFLMNNILPYNFMNLLEYLMINTLSKHSEYKMATMGQTSKGYKFCNSMG